MVLFSKPLGPLEPLTISVLPLATIALAVLSKAHYGG